MLFRVAALAFFFEWALATEAPVDGMDWGRRIALPPNCRTCQMMFDDHWIDESARSNLCWNTQMSLMFDSLKCQEVMASGDAKTGYQFCAMTGVCPSQREYCMNNYDQAMLEPSPADATMLEIEAPGDPRPTTVETEYIPLTATEKQNALCQSIHTYFGIDVNGCRGAFEKFNATADTFCHRNPYFTTDDKGGVVDKVCASTVHPIACDATNGVLSQVPMQTEYSVVDASIGVSKTYYILDYCQVIQACVCNEGFTGADCSTAVPAAFIDTKSTFAKRTGLANNDTLAHSHREFPKLKPITLSSFKMGAAVNGIPDCDGANWAYYQDDIDDSVGGGVESCGMAVRQSHDYLEVAIVSQIGYVCSIVCDGNLPRTADDRCQMVWNCLGDLIMNMETDGNGIHVPLSDAMAASKLFGVRAMPQSDSSAMSMDQVFGAAQFTAAGPMNKGWTTTQEYVDQYIVESNGASPHHGGGIDSYENHGLGYLGGLALNSLVSGSEAGNVTERYVAYLEGALDNSSPYYPYEDEYSQIDGEHLTTLGLDLASNLNGFMDVCGQVTYIKMQRAAFPLEGGSMLMHNSPECFNDVSAAKFDLCPIVSETPTHSPTPSKSQSKSPTPIPPFIPPPPEEFITCTCFPGQTADFNTLALGDFTGGSDTEGKLGICGNAHLESYSVGSKLNTTEDTTFFVNGDLSFATGDVKFGNVKVGGNPSVGESVHNGLVSGGQTIVKASLGSMCDSISATLTDLAASLSNHPSYGFTTQELEGELIVHRASPGSDGVVFLDVNCTELHKVNHMKFSGVAVGETLVVNFRPFDFTEEIDGVEQTWSMCNLEEMQIDIADPARTVFNFGSAQKVTINAVSIDASILAPLSSVSGKGGMINGQSIFGSFVGITQQNLHLCQGCLSIAEAQPQLPAAEVEAEAMFARMRLNSLRKDQTLSPQ